jgi:WD40 repeat protein
VHVGRALVCVLQVRDHSQAILCLSPTAHADRLLTASKDNQLRLWDFRQLGTVQVRLLKKAWVEGLPTQLIADRLVGAANYDGCTSAATIGLQAAKHHAGGLCVA